ncbi:MAG: hypothetical protein C4532_17075 [Candidatus Abyssobacteria bacterium SURF_17]|uniref:Uncharacterized protein n=1 Tax=Candidatus Abyssobacteria bacterium SURF_17 TaxID=2093361 RepID=A0A419ERA9_9BACT|nr:MAG: hypothetical protein C4532_17075 [Candidatus Abyssubacteria bacterium SURF_17]
MSYEYASEDGSIGAYVVGLDIRRWFIGPHVVGATRWVARATDILQEVRSARKALLDRNSLEHSRGRSRTTLTMWPM